MGGHLGVGGLKPDPIRLSVEALERDFPLGLKPGGDHVAIVGGGHVLEEDDVAVVDEGVDH